MKIAVGTTATLRPELLKKTYESFYDKMFKQYRGKVDLFLNIDMIGGDTSLHPAIVDIAHKYFPSIKKIRTPKEPSAPQAVKWIFDNCIQGNYDYLFFLEDDWFLNLSVDLNHYLFVINKHTSYAHLRLNRDSTIDIKDSTFLFYERPHKWNKFLFHCNDRQKTAHYGWGGNPALTSVKYIKEVYPFLRWDTSIDRQLKLRHVAGKLKNVMLNWDYGFYGQYPLKCERFIEDTGRCWRADRNIIKYANMKWEKS